MKEYYKITEVARLYGLCTDTLRYYEEQGLLHPHRSEAGYRLYSIDDICNLNVIRALRELDMPVEHMRRYFGERTVASTLDMLDEQDAAIRARIAALRDARAAVDARRARLERYDGQEPGLLRLLELPVSATEDMLLGGVELEAAVRTGCRTFQPGLLARADGAVLYADEVNLLPSALTAALLDTLETGVCRVERDGISHTCPARFALVGTMNPEEGTLRPQLLDRFGLYVAVTGEQIGRASCRERV